MKNLDIKASCDDERNSVVTVDESLVYDLKYALGFAKLESSTSGEDYFLLRLQEELEDFVGGLIMQFSGRRARDSHTITCGLFRMLIPLPSSSNFSSS